MGEEAIRSASPAAAASDAPARPRLGELLVHDGALSPARLRAALAAQPGTGARIGAILAARGWAAPEAVAAAAATQAGLDLVDLDAAPLAPAALAPADLDICLRRRLAPWRRGAAGETWVGVDAQDAASGLRALSAPPDRARLALATPHCFARAFAAAHGPALGARAAARAPERLSARSIRRGRWGAAAAAGLAALGLAAAVAPSATLGWAFLVLLLLNAMNGVLRIAAFGAALARRSTRRAPLAAPSTPAGPPPCVTLLVPLFREPETAPVLLEALQRIDWPPELLDVKLILEEGDAATRAALERHAPPPFCQILTAPAGAPRTKPRALNFALDFAEGEIVGIYDAEDRPDPDQIRRAAAALAAHPPEVAAVQARLSYFNPRENWLTRCFTIEYALWFDVLLTGYRALGLPIPLGGTSVFFRRRALEAAGAWDAHNVTEDADLGIRLARAGYRCEVLDSTTEEEANSRLVPWIKQRSRWLKGYAQTWAVHMRRPGALWRALGTRGFLGFQAIFLGGMVAYFGAPVFLGVWGAALLGAGPGWAEAAPLWAFAALAALHFSAWLAMFGAAVAATGRRGRRWLLPWIPTLAFYWPLGALAAALALAELAIAPFHWRKTRHGVGRVAAAARAEAVAARAARAERSRA